MAISIERLTSLLRVAETSLAPVASVAEDHGDHVVERLRFRWPGGLEIRGFLTRPTANRMPRPASSMLMRMAVETISAQAS